MGFRTFVTNLRANSDFLGTSNAGLFNVETGNASFRTEWVSECECSISTFLELQYECKNCDKSPKNSISIQSGDGDGLYTVQTFYNRSGEIFASVTLFDEESELAKEFIQHIESGTIYDLHPQDFWRADFPCIEVGSLKLSKERKVFYSDSSAGLDSSMPTVWTEKWVSGGLTVYACVENSTDSTLAQVSISLGEEKEKFNGGLESSFRPRAVLLISDAYKEMTKGLVDLELSKEEWKEQISAWSVQHVASHMQNQSDAAIYWNARIQNQYARRAETNGGVNVPEYEFQEFSWLLQGATYGHQACADAVKEMIEESEGELLEAELLRLAYSYRGLLSLANDVQ
jgi:hypothetical protein